MNNARMRHLYAGIVTTMIADSLLLITLSIWVKTLTNSNALAGLTFLFTTLPALAVPLLSYALDRAPSKKILSYGNLACAILILPLILATTQSRLWIIYAVCTAYGFSLVIFPSAINGLVKGAVEPERMPTVNATVQTTKQGLRLLGPILGAAIFSFTGTMLPVVALSSALFAVAAYIIWKTQIPAPDNANVKTPSEPLVVEATKGFRYIKTSPRLRSGLASIGLMTMVIGFFESSIYAMLDSLHQRPAAAAIVVTAQGFGALAAGLSSPSVIRRTDELTTIVVGLALLAISFAVIATTTSFATATAAAVIMGMALPLITVAMTTLVQRETPDDVIIRVSTVVELFATGPQALSLAMGSFLVSLIYWRAIFWIMFGAMIVAVGPSLRAIRKTRVQLRTKKHDSSKRLRTNDDSTGPSHP